MTCAGVLVTSGASANGRFPGATQLVIREHNAVITTSFGVVMTGDSFATQRWACEEAIGYDPSLNNDLGAAIFSDGSLVLTGPIGTTISTDGGCTHTKVTGPVASIWMSDVSAEPQDPTRGIAVSRGPDATSCAGEVFETADNGRSWTRLATLPAEFCAFTIDSAPSKRERLYVSGNKVAADGVRLIAQLLVSDDRGTTWSAHDIPDQARPFIGAVDPVDPDTVYVRTLKPPMAGDLLVSRDGGTTFRTIASVTGPLQYAGLTGLAISPDGSKLAFGSVKDGLFVIEEKDGEPQKRADFPIMCLTWTEEGLHACSTPALCGPFFVGRSRDDGATFSPILSTLDVNGAETSCPPETPLAKQCPSQWASVRERLGGCDENEGDAGPAADAGGDAGAAPPPPPKLNCDCSVADLGRPRPLAFAGVCVAFAVALGRRLARRRR
jgi:photosystem II stability/assembly factor-like uncharacterized protein